MIIKKQIRVFLVHGSKTSSFVIYISSKNSFKLEKKRGVLVCWSFINKGIDDMSKVQFFMLQQTFIGELRICTGQNEGEKGLLFHQ
jgi:hypothetical protein